MQLLLTVVLASIKLTILLYCVSGPDGACVLARALQDNQTLRQLNLSWSKLRAGGAAALADVLRHNTTLQVLDLSRNNVGDKGAQALAAAMPECSLACLDLSHNNIRATGASELAARIGMSEVRFSPARCCETSDSASAERAGFSFVPP